MYKYFTTAIVFKINMYDIQESRILAPYRPGRNGTIDVNPVGNFLQLSGRTV